MRCVRVLTYVSFFSAAEVCEFSNGFRCSWCVFCSSSLNKIRSNKLNEKDWKDRSTRDNYDFCLIRIDFHSTQKIPAANSCIDGNRVVDVMEHIAHTK